MQLTMFGGVELLKITKPIRLIELFGGIGCQAQALTNIGANFEHYRLCEFDKYAIASYNAIHSTSFKKSDVRDWSGCDLGICNTDKFEYLLTYSFPCQDLSTAGKQLGLTKGSGTRSGLLWEVERLLNGCQELPQVLLMENVPQVHSSNNMEDFRMWLEFLESKGYKNYYQDLNATSYGVAQNRDRCFMVSCLGDYYFDFPQGFKLEKRLKDYLEAEVDEKYYLSDKMLKYITANNGKWTANNDKSLINKSVASTINTGEGSRRCDASNFICDNLPSDFNLKDPKCAVVGNLHMHGRLESACRVYSVDGVAPACNTFGGGGLETKILEPTILQQGHGFAESRELELCPTVTGEAWNYNNFLKEPTIIEDFYANREAREYADTCPTLRSDRSGLKVKEPIAYDEQNKRLRMDGTVGTITTDGSTPKHNNRVVCSDYRIRKLTPKECWRLMGWQDEQFEKAKAVNSNSQLYKQAGNGICVPVLEQIFKEML